MAYASNARPSRRALLQAAGATVASMALPSAAFAQSGWTPSKNVEFVNGTAAGGSNDIIARLAQNLMEAHGIVKQPIIVSNRVGAGGAVGLRYLVGAAPDGHTIAVGNPTLLTTHITGHSPYTYTDVTPLVVLQQQYIGFATSASSRFKTAQDLVDALRADPRSVSISIGAAVGNQNHTTAALLAKAIGVNPGDLKVVVYDSGGASVTAAIGGHVDIGLTGAGEFVAHVESGSLRILAVAAAERQPDALADVPTLKEVIGTEVVGGNWYGFFGPPGMERDRIDFWVDAFSQVVARDEWIQRMRALYNAPRFMNREQTAKLFEDDYKRLKEVLGELGLAG